MLVISRAFFLSQLSRNSFNTCTGFFRHPGPYSPTILKNVFSLVLQIFLYLETFECNRTSDWLNGMVYPIRSCVTFKFTKSVDKDK